MQSSWIIENVSRSLAIGLDLFDLCMIQEWWLEACCIELSWWNSRYPLHHQDKWSGSESNICTALQDTAQQNPILPTDSSERDAIRMEAHSISALSTLIHINQLLLVQDASWWKCSSAENKAVIGRAVWLQYTQTTSILKNSEASPGACCRWNSNKTNKGWLTCFM